MEITLVLLLFFGSLGIALWCVRGYLISWFGSGGGVGVEVTAEPTLATAVAPTVIPVPIAAVAILGEEMVVAVVRIDFYHCFSRLAQTAQERLQGARS